MEVGHRGLTSFCHPDPASVRFLGEKNLTRALSSELQIGKLFSYSCNYRAVLHGYYNKASIIAAREIGQASRKLHQQKGREIKGFRDREMKTIKDE